MAEWPPATCTGKLCQCHLNLDVSLHDAIAKFQAQGSPRPHNRWSKDCLLAGSTCSWSRPHALQGENGPPFSFVHVSGPSTVALMGLRRHSLFSLCCQAQQSFLRCWNAATKASEWHDVSPFAFLYLRLKAVPQHGRTSPPESWMLLIASTFTACIVGMNIHYSLEKKIYQNCRKAVKEEYTFDKFDLIYITGTVYSNQVSFTVMSSTLIIQIVNRLSTEVRAGPQLFLPTLALSYF